MIYESTLELIGRTPMLRLNKLGCSNVCLKLEKNNPAGSIKDRAVCCMIEQMEINGELTEGDILVEATSGNTGIALSMIGKLKNYKVIIVMPENMSKERIMLMKAYGAKIILTDKSLGMKGSIDMMNKLKSENSNYKSLNQFDNKNNALAHYKGTGVEIYNDMPDIDIFVCGVGTAGTIVGTAKYLKEKNPNIKVIALEPETSPAISKGKGGPHGIQGIGAGFVTGVYEDSLVDEVMLISDKDAYDMVRTLAEKEGILVGISAGCNVFGATKLAEKYPNKKIVTVAPDGIDKYMSMDIF